MSDRPEKHRDMGCEHHYCIKLFIYILTCIENINKNNSETQFEMFEI